MGNGSTSNCMYVSEGSVFVQASVSWRFGAVMRIPSTDKIKNLIIK